MKRTPRITVTFPGTFVDYMRGTEAWDADITGTEGPGSRELGKALRNADRRKVGRGYSVTVTLSERALDIARDYALDMGETGGCDYEPSWPRAARVVIDRIDAAVEPYRQARILELQRQAELEARHRLALEEIRAERIAAEVRAAVGATLGMSAGLRRPR